MGQPKDMHEKFRKIIKDNYNLSEEDIETATVDIVERCFVITGIPRNEDLLTYIADYMER